MSIAQPDIKPAFKERNIPVAFATDENYLPYVKILINSIAASTQSGNLDILILNDGVPRGKEKEFLKDFRGQDGVSVRFLNVGKFVKRTALSEFEQRRYLSIAACYRLFLPDMLVAYDKMIYLDVDTSVCRDLGDLYAVDLGGNLFGAAIDVVNARHMPEYAEWARGHGFVDWDKYVNTGVLLLDLAAFRKAKLLDKLLSIAVEASQWYCDQDALNFVCNGRIQILDPRWNVQVGDYCLKQQLAITNGEAYIYHFTSRKKPWNHPDHKYAYSWWRNARGDGGPWLWRRALGLDESLADGRKVRISVIVPVFNAEHYLWECLLSVLVRAEAAGVEVVCIDDGSSDGSCEMLQTLQALDPRVKLFRQRHQGPGVARNLGMANATGDYILFLDADDRLSLASRLDVLLKRAMDDGLDMLVCGGNMMAEDGTVLRKAWLNESFIPAERVFGPEALGNNLYLLTSQGPVGKIFRRSFLLGEKISFPPLRRSEDFAFVQLAYALAKRIGVETCPLVDRRVGVETSCESTKDETPLIFLDGEKAFLDAMKRHRILKKFRTAADVSSVLRLAYNLGAVRRFDGFVSIARKAKDVYLPLKERIADAMPLYLAKSVELLDKIVANVEDLECLAELFAELQCNGKISKLDFDVALAHARQRCTALEKDLAAALAKRDVLKKALEATRGVRDAALKERDSLKTMLAGVRKVRDEALAKRDAMKKSLDEVRGVRDAALKERVAGRGPRRSGRGAQGA